MAQFNQAPPKPKNLTQNLNFRLTADKLEGGNWPPSYAMVVVGNNIRIDVWSNRDGDKNKGNVSTVVTPGDCQLILNSIRSARELPNGEKSLVLGHEDTYWEGGRPKEKYVKATTHVGKDKDGFVYIALVAKNMEPIQFRINSPSAKYLLGADGQPLPLVTNNKMYSLAWADLIEKVVFSILPITYVAPIPKPRVAQAQGPAPTQDTQLQFDSKLPF